MPSLEKGVNALILLSSKEEPGIEEDLRKVLEPFSLIIEDIQRIALRDRLILGVLISCDPAHLRAIEADLTEFGERNGLDIAIDYSQEV